MIRIQNGHGISQASPCGLFNLNTGKSFYMDITLMFTVTSVIMSLYNYPDDY